jgi:hypothetical protein
MSWFGLKNLIKLLKIVLCGEFWTYKTYSKTGSGLVAINSEDIAIVIQGPLSQRNNFTLETIKLYRRNIPTAKIIFSTWDLPQNVLRELESLNVSVIINKRPENAGIFNINLQITTSKPGILLAKNLGFKYVLKTRSDQRINHPNYDIYLFNLLNTFPIKSYITNQKKRLIGLSLNTFKHRLYGISDMFLFGHIDDMLNYWNVDFDYRPDTPEERINAGNTLGTYSRWRVCEVYLCTEFLKKIGHAADFTLLDSYRVLGDRFLILDHEAIDLYWHKYTNNQSRYKVADVYDPQISFNDWLYIANNVEMLEVDESILN